MGVFRNPAALLRLAGSVLVEAHNEWQVADKRDVSEATLALLNTGDDHRERCRDSGSHSIVRTCRVSGGARQNYNNWRAMKGWKG